MLKLKCSFWWRFRVIYTHLNVWVLALACDGNQFLLRKYQQMGLPRGVFLRYPVLDEGRNIG